MAKSKTSKSASRRKRRQRRPNIPKSTGPVDQPAALRAKVAKPKPAATLTPKKEPVNFSKEYHYVLTDLRSMVIVTSAMVVLLLVLNFLAI